MNRMNIRSVQLVFLFLALAARGFGQGRDPDLLAKYGAEEAAVAATTAGAQVADAAAQPVNAAPASSPAAAKAAELPEGGELSALAETLRPEAAISPVAAAAPKEGPFSPETIVSSGILVDGLHYDIPMPWGHEQFEDLRASYMTSGGKKWLNAVMERALPYLAYVEKRVKELGLPQELVFLPVIESEYSPFAVSKSGATGIWQFMRNSISGYNMAISEWKDERKDFMKSTDAALLKLKENYNVLGDWLLAIAAYNAGLGAVMRAVKSASGEVIDFWRLYESKTLSSEPLSYVPKFLAVASILSYPALHGLPDGWGEKDDWEALTTTRQVDLQVLSERTGIPYDVLKKGNAELKYKITPPAGAHLVKVPADKVEAVKAVLDDTSTPLFRYDIYKVKSGDTMGAIAKRYSTSLGVILQANPGLKPDRIKIGQALIIPHLPDSGADSKSDSKSASSASGATKTAAKTAAKAADQSSSKDSGSGAAAYGAVYVVKKGDTLSDISLRFNVKPKDLARQNGIGVNAVLKVGAKLKVPAREAAE